ncbi:unnamed protein product [Linum trigynum]|uniref:Maturase K n=1 Tax=Linum trigynum TaxID=586398 RepID=A0AAV2DFK4_9ROSI
MFSSIQHQFGQIYYGSIFGRFQRDTITDFGRFFRIANFLQFWRLKITESGRDYSSTMIKSIENRFRRINSGSIFGKFQRGVITNFARFFRNAIFLRLWRLKIMESGRGYSLPIMKSIDPILHG